MQLLAKTCKNARIVHKWSCNVSNLVSCGKIGYVTGEDCFHSSTTLRDASRIKRTLPRPKKYAPGIFFYGLSSPIEAAKNPDTRKGICVIDASIPDTSRRDADGIEGTLPRPKEHAPGMFFYGLSSPSSSIKISATPCGVADILVREMGLEPTRR